MRGNGMGGGSAMGGAQATAVFVRLVGAGVAVFGLACVYFVIETAWGLFEGQQAVQQVAVEIEARSGAGAYMDARFHQLMSKLDAIQPRGGRGAAADPPTHAGALAAEAPSAPVSYVMAWAIVLALLALLARIGIAALVQGARLAMPATADPQLRAVVRELAAELRAERAVEQRAERAAPGGRGDGPEGARAGRANGSAVRV